MVAVAIVVVAIVVVVVVVIVVVVVVVSVVVQKIPSIFLTSNLFTVISFMWFLLPLKNAYVWLYCI